MAIALTDEFDPREAVWLVGSAFDNDETRELAFEFVKHNLSALLARLPDYYGAGFIDLSDSFCDEAHRADAEAFFKDKAPTYLGGPRALAQTLEKVDLCIARKHAREASAAAFLAKW
jgi:alanyl aminopeptidase